ncbi:MAG TPA: aminotransferase class I/II-fold pyridoxal phosphate-dependent enzyme [Thermoanaerobaculia bacterium]|nr:aminotransferase class I/II-fold pyridoxal phosphate-dependent enzyme [Thermoanaerobaculia bacterium]
MSVRSDVARMTAYTLELRHAEVKLNQNESPFDFPPELKQQVLDRVAKRSWNIYPDFESISLRSAIARSLTGTRGPTEDNILTGNGSNELLAAAISAFVGPGTPVVLPRPTFTLYEKLVTIAGGLPIPIEFDPDSGFLPLQAMLNAIAEYPGAIVIVCSPNNPTGGVLPPHGLEALLDTGATVLFDRAYGDFANDTMPQLHDRLVTFSTFSKAWGLAALRVGWLASTAANCREIRKVKLPYSLNIISEAIAEIALENRDVRDRNVAAIVSERERVFDAMRNVPRITVFPTAANFITFRTQRALFEELCARGILVRDVSAYPRLASCLRVSIGSRDQNDRFLAALTEIA